MSGIGKRKTKKITVVVSYLWLLKTLELEVVQMYPYAWVI
jgi:hypothetical protein